MRLGDRYSVGQAIIEVTKLRVPCATLNFYNEPELPPIQDAVFDKQVKAGDTRSPKWGLAGFYARVVKDGLVRSGDRISFLDTLT